MRRTLLLFAVAGCSNGAPRVALPEGSAGWIVASPSGVDALDPKIGPAVELDGEIVLFGYPLPLDRYGIAPGPLDGACRSAPNPDATYRLSDSAWLSLGEAPRPLPKIACAECGARRHDGGDGLCVASSTCAAGRLLDGVSCVERCEDGFHDGGDRSCVRFPGCAVGYHDGGDERCVPRPGCSTGFHNDGLSSCAPVGDCADGYHDGGDGACTPSGRCAEGYHDGGDTRCVKGGACSDGYHDAGDATCVRIGECAPDFHDDGRGECVLVGCAEGFGDGGAGCAPIGTCSPGYHPDEGRCVPLGTCAPGRHDDGSGACVEAGCLAGYHDGGTGACVPDGTCSRGFVFEGGACRPLAGDCPSCATILFTNDFERPNDTPMGSCDETLDERGVTLYDGDPRLVRVAEKSDVVLLGAPDAHNGRYAIDLRTDTRLDVLVPSGGRRWITVGFDLTAFDVLGCGGPFAPTRPMVIVGLRPSNDVPLLTRTVVGSAPSAGGPTWRSVVAVFDTARSVDTRFKVTFELARGKLVAIDNLSVVASDEPGLADLDADGVADDRDVCLGTPNPDQAPEACACPVGQHEGGRGGCLPIGECAPEFHDGGRGACVPTAGCEAGFHDDGLGRCVVRGACASGQSPDPTGACVPDGCSGPVGADCRPFGCGDGACRIYCRAPLSNFDAAKAICADWGGHLAFVDSYEEDVCLARNFIPFEADPFGFPAAWIGLRQRLGASRAGEGWSWGDGRAVSEPLWANHEPSDETGSQAEDCAWLYTYLATWNDASCELSLGFFCER